MFGITPSLDKVIWPVLESGVLAPSTIPPLHFSEEYRYFKAPHRSFSWYPIISGLESGGDKMTLAYKLFEFFYKLVLYSFVTLPFMGSKNHEVVEVLWNVLEGYPQWEKLAHHHGIENVYLLVNYVIRYGTRRGVKDRNIYFINLYVEIFPNRLQSIVFKVNATVV